MPWDEVIRQAPAFGALCFLVVMAGKHIRGITTAYMNAMKEYMVQVRELSETCHNSHEAVSVTMADAIKDVRNTIEGARATQIQMAETLRELTLLIRRNGIK